MTDSDRSRTIVCIGTGPSLTDRQVEVARGKGFQLFGCNRTFVDFANLDLCFGNDLKFWERYMPLLEEYTENGTQPKRVATGSKEAAERWPVLEYFEPIFKPGLSVPRETGQQQIHHGHGAGYSLVNVAYLSGADQIILLGYDLKYPKNYDARNRDPGGQRHYFGEYEEPLQHWPSERINKDGVHEELCELYQTVAEQGLVEIINCSADSALECFPRMPIEEVEGRTRFV